MKSVEKNRKNCYEKASFCSRKYFQLNKKSYWREGKIWPHTNPKCRLYHYLKGKIYWFLGDNAKTSSTKDLFGMDIEICRKPIEFQVGPETEWNEIQIDHVKPFSSVDMSENEELREAFNWKNTQPI